MGQFPFHLTVFSFLLLGTVVSIAYIDLRRLIIPDHLNALLALGGLTYQFLIRGAISPTIILAATGVFVAFYAIRFAFYRVRGETGLGLGDVKMAAAATLWIEPLNVPLLVLVASLLGIAVIGLIRLAGGADLSSLRLPFGPFLGSALIAVWSVETSLSSAMLRTEIGTVFP